MKIGFIGLGNMGSAMAMNLLKAGHNVTVYNRTAQKAKPLVDQGAHAAADPAEASRADVVFTMLADDRAVESVSCGESGILAHLQPGSVHISSSTISVDLSQKLAAAHEKRSQQFIAAPVFGRPEAAAAGKLIVVVAGRTDAIDRCTPLFDVIGQRTFRFWSGAFGRQFNQAGISSSPRYSNLSAKPWRSSAKLESTNMSMWIFLPRLFSLPQFTKPRVCLSLTGNFSLPVLPPR